MIGKGGKKEHILGVSIGNLWIIPLFLMKIVRINNAKIHYKYKVS